MAVDRQQVAGAVDEAQRFKPPVVVDPTRSGLPGPQLVQRARGGIACAGTARVGIVDPEPRQHAADGVAAPDAFLAPVARAVRAVERFGAARAGLGNSRRIVCTGTASSVESGAMPNAAAPDKPSTAIAANARPTMRESARARDGAGLR